MMAERFGQVADAFSPHHPKRGLEIQDDAGIARSSWSVVEPVRHLETVRRLECSQQSLVFGRQTFACSPGMARGWRSICDRAASTLRFNAFLRAVGEIPRDIGSEQQPIHERHL